MDGVDPTDAEVLKEESAADWTLLLILLTNEPVCSCLPMTPRFAQNLNMAINNWSRKHLNLEKPLKSG